MFSVLTKRLWGEAAYWSINQAIVWLGYKSKRERYIYRERDRAVSLWIIHDSQKPIQEEKGIRLLFWPFVQSGSLFHSVHPYETAPANGNTDWLAHTDDGRAKSFRGIIQAHTYKEGRERERERSGIAASLPPTSKYFCFFFNLSAPSGKTWSTRQRCIWYRRGGGRRRRWKRNENEMREAWRLSHLVDWITVD